MNGKDTSFLERTSIVQSILSRGYAQMSYEYPEKRLSR